MSSILKQLALLIGGILFLVALGLALLSGAPLLEALYRALIVLLLGSVAVALFFRYFAGILYKFVIERVTEPPSPAAETAPPPPPGAPADKPPTPPQAGTAKPPPPPQPGPAKPPPPPPPRKPAPAKGG